MGLFDMFKSKRQKNNQEEERNFKNDEPDLNLNFSSGINAQVNFGDVIDYEGKHLQKVHIMYLMANGQFRGQSCYMDPHVGYDENGVAVYDTKEHYKTLQREGKTGLIKGFFKLEEVEKIKAQDGTDYLGYIDYDERGNPTRSYDENFKQYYIKKCAIKKEMEDEKTQYRMDQELSQLIEDSKNNTGYQNMIDNQERLFKEKMEQSPERE